MCSSATSGLAAPTAVAICAPQPRGLEHVGLVDRGDLLPPAARPAGTPAPPRAASRSRDTRACRPRARRRRQLLARPSAGRSRARPSARGSRGCRRPRAAPALSGDASTSAGWTLTGRRLAKTPEPLAQREQPLLRPHLACGSSHFGPPTAPSSTASAARHAASDVVGQRGAVRVDRRSRRSSCSSNSNVWPCAARRPPRAPAAPPPPPPARCRRPGSSTNLALCTACPPLGDGCDCVRHAPSSGRTRSRRPARASSPR